MSAAMQINSEKNIHIKTIIDNLREECDPLADKAIDIAVLKLGKDCLKSRNLLASIKQLSKDGVYECRSFLDFYQREPPWGVDWSAVDTGRRFFVRNTVIGGLVLMYGSLVSSFTASKGNKVRPCIWGGGYLYNLVM
jgi:hypothetical protein